MSNEEKPVNDNYRNIDMSNEEKPANDNDRNIDMSKVTITRGLNKEEPCLDGVVNDYPDYQFSAKVYDECSRFGIDCGRISILAVKHQGEEVIHYSRGWGTKPSTPEQYAVLECILAGFPGEHPQKFLAEGLSLTFLKAQHPEREFGEYREEVNKMSCDRNYTRKITSTLRGRQT